MEDWYLSVLACHPPSNTSALLLATETLSCSVLNFCAHCVVQSSHSLWTEKVGCRILSVRLTVLGRSSEQAQLFSKNACVCLSMHCPAVSSLITSLVIGTLILMLCPFPTSGHQELACVPVILVALQCVLSSVPMSLLVWGAQNWTQSSSCGLTSAEWRARTTSLDLPAALCLLHPRVPSAFFVARAPCWLVFSQLLFPVLFCLQTYRGYSAPSSTSLMKT